MSELRKNRRLPLLDLLREEFRGVRLDDVAIVSCQHILDSNFITLRYLFELGLRPERTFILGKAYSTNADVAAAMADSGINVHAHSFSFDSHEAWDDQFRRYVAEFNGDALRSLEALRGVHKIILVDDGGFVIEHAHSSFGGATVTAVEWTSSGYRKLLAADVPVPIVNMARSKSKLAIESPFIAEGVAKKIEDEYSVVLESDRPALIVGAGSIGSSVRACLETRGKRCVVIDLGDPRPDMEEFDLVVGCTGACSLDAGELSMLRGAVLVSASSSDREFDAVRVRKNSERTDDTHRSYSTDSYVLANAGFPINFDGAPQFIPYEEIQITLGLVFASVCLCASADLTPGLNEFPPALDDSVAERFTRVFARG